MISPITVANLNPCPENPAAIETCGHSGCTSKIKCSSGEFVNMQVFIANVAPSASGKYFRTPSRSTASSAGPQTTGSFGIGMGGITFKAVLFWLLVGIPLAWGIWNTVEKALVLFTG